MNFFAYKKWAIFPEIEYSVKHSDTLVCTIQSVFMKFKFSILDNQYYPICNEDVIIDYDVVKSIIQSNDQKYKLEFCKKTDYTLVTVSDNNEYLYLLVELQEPDNRILSCISVGRSCLVENILRNNSFIEFIKPYELEFIKKRENYLIESRTFVSTLESFQKKHLYSLGKIV